MAHLASAESCSNCKAPLTNVAVSESTTAPSAPVAPPARVANVAPRPRISRPLVVDTPERTFAFNPLFVVVLAVLLIAVVGYQFTGSSISKSNAAAKEKELVARITENIPGTEVVADKSLSLSKGDPDAQDAEVWDVDEPDFDRLLKDEQGVWGAALSSGAREMEASLRNVAPQRTGAYDPNKVRADIVKAGGPVCPGRVEDIELVDYKFSDDGDDTVLHIKVEGETYKGNSDSERKICQDATHLGTATRNSVYVWKAGDRKWVPKVKMAKS